MSHDDENDSKDDGETAVQPQPEDLAETDATPVDAEAENETGAEEAPEPAAEPENGEDAEAESTPKDEGASAEDEDGDDDEEEVAEEGTENVEALPLASVVEALLFAAREALKPAQIARAVGKGTRQDAIRTAVEELNVHYLETGRAFEIAEISERYQLMSRPEYARHIMRIYPKRDLQTDKDKTQRLTPAAMDTLAIIAYKQPVMRSEIERIRGVACGPVLKMLIERGSVKQIGRRTDLVGKPAVFGTTERFLAEFGLGSLDELPLRNDYLPAPGEEPQVELIPDGDNTEPAEAAEEAPTDAAEAPEAQPETAPEEASEAQPPAPQEDEEPPAEDDAPEEPEEEAAGE